MPEGDTIFRAAATLQRVLGGQRLVSCESTLPAVTQADFEGHVVTRVEARGKNLLMHFDDGRTLHTHMKMNGSWHVYRVGERWFKKTEAARIVMTTAEFVAVCFSAPVVRVIARGGLALDPLVKGLGPDLLDPSFDAELALRNFRAEPGLEVGDALLQQRLVAGVGNVFKSEVLFVCRTSPFRTLSTLDDDAVAAILSTARKQLARNAQNRGPRTTRVALTGPRYWVYLRAREGCLVCATTVEMRRQGAVPRSTYFCPKCQAA